MKAALAKEDLVTNYAIPRGTLNWDVPLNAATASIDTRLTQISFNVKEYGALGNGSNNDAPGIQAAINAAAIAGGGIVYIPAGVYILNQTLNIPAGEGLTIQGSGWGTSLKLGNNVNTYALTFGGTDTRITVRDLEIDGNYLQQSGVSGGINGAGAIACLFSNIHFTFCRDESLLLAGLTGGAFGHVNRVIGCLFDQTTGSAGSGRGVHMTSNDENQIIFCDFEFLGGAGSNAASIYDESGTNFINSCNFVNGANNSKGIWIQNAKSTKVTNCNFDGLSGDNVFIAGQRCIVSNNTFFSPGIAGTAGQASGVYLEFGTSANVIVGNMIASAPGAGVSRDAIRESSSGGGGNNNISHNMIVTDGAWSFAALDLSGAGSTVIGNTGTPTAGQATLVAGTVTVSTSAITTNSVVVASAITPGGTQGALFVSALTAGTSFTLKSTSATDTSVVRWIILKQS